MLCSSRPLDLFAGIDNIRRIKTVLFKQIGFDESADLLRDARIVYGKQQMIGLRSWIDQQIKANGQIHIFEKFLS